MTYQKDDKKILHKGDTQCLEVCGQQHQYPNKQKQTERKNRCWMLGVGCHLSPVTCHLSPVTCNMSPVTCHLSPVTCQMSPVTNANRNSHRPSPYQLPNYAQLGKNFFQYFFQYSYYMPLQKNVKISQLLWLSGWRVKDQTSSILGNVNLVL